MKTNTNPAHEGKGNLQEFSRDITRHEAKYGVFLWWSEQTPSWVHPDDVTVADQLVPGNRIFRREDCENFADRELGYSTFRYGDSRFRGLPAIWLEVRTEGFEINDLVEIKSGFGKLRPGIATIAEIKWNRHARTIEYFLTVNGRQIKRPFKATEIQPAVRLNSHMGFRELALAARLRFA